MLQLERLRIRRSRRPSGSVARPNTVPPRPFLVPMFFLLTVLLPENRVVDDDRVTAWPRPPARSRIALVGKRIAAGDAEDPCSPGDSSREAADSRPTIPVAKIHPRQAGQDVGNGHCALARKTAGVYVDLDEHGTAVIIGRVARDKRQRAY